MQAKVGLGKRRMVPSPITQVFLFIHDLVAAEDGIDDRILFDAVDKPPGINMEDGKGGEQPHHEMVDQAQGLEGDEGNPPPSKDLPDEPMMKLGKQGKAGDDRQMVVQNFRKSRRDPPL
jgi:hypothetical protein